jgi:hypothetical protein
MRTMQAIRFNFPPSPDPKKRFRRLAADVVNSPLALSVTEG